MGGSGAALTNGTYGTEYRALLAVDGMKIIRQNDESRSLRTPMVSKVPYRIYAVQGFDSTIKSLTFHDADGYRYKQVDLSHPHRVGKVITFRHTHVGYYHDEVGGTRNLSSKERQVVAKALAYNRRLINGK